MVGSEVGVGVGSNVGASVGAGVKDDANETRSGGYNHADGVG